ncbi:MAG: chemotaxis protein CheX [Nitrosomonadales bacterium]|nr:chemotaxis protein CheX [Nitrosomonadales bacterium]
MMRQENGGKEQHLSSEQQQSATSVNYEGRMDMVMTHALLESLFIIFATMVRLQIQPGVPIPKQDNIAKGHVSGLIGMKADGASGSVALSLTLPTIREISRSLLGQEITDIDKDAADLAGELTNMLVGGAKRILSEKGHDFDMQTPELLQGDRHEIVHHFSGQTVLLPIMIDQHEFYIELNFV